MGIELMEYEGAEYPAHVQSGNAVRFIEPMALEFCKGEGLDIGGTNQWRLAGAKAINIIDDNEWHAMNLPERECDYIFTSHTLEHLDEPRQAIRYWRTRLKQGGVLFLYLPHASMAMWHPSRMSGHSHSFLPEEITALLEECGFRRIFASGRDLNWSFAVVGEKA